MTISNVELTANAPTTVDGTGSRNAYGGVINLDHVYQHGNIDALCWCGNSTIRDSYSLIYLAIANDHLENLYIDDHSLTRSTTCSSTRHRKPPTSSPTLGMGLAARASNQLTISNNLLAGGGFSSLLRVAMPRRRAHRR